MSASDKFTHLDNAGRPHMVDVSAKEPTSRLARAEGEIRMLPATLKRISDRGFDKGDVLQVAQLAAIQAAKETSRIIPLCHGLPLEGTEIEWSFEPPERLRVTTTSRVTAKTGVEMEALVAASVALLTVYDMCKAVDRAMEIGPIRLIEKRGGRSGHYRRDSDSEPDAKGDTSGCSDS